MGDVLKFTARVRVWLTKNELTMADQEFYTEDRNFTESAHQRVVLSVTTAAPGDLQEFDLGGVNPGYGLMVETDRQVMLGVDNGTNLIQLQDNGCMFLTGNYTHVYVRNDSLTYQATVEMLSFDLEDD